MSRRFLFTLIILGRSLLMSPSVSSCLELRFSILSLRSPQHKHIRQHGSHSLWGQYRTPRRLSLLCTLRVRRVPFHVWRGADFARQRKIWERRPFWDAPRQQSGAIANVVIATDKSDNAPQSRHSGYLSSGCDRLAPSAAGFMPTF